MAWAENSGLHLRKRGLVDAFREKTMEATIDQVRRVSSGWQHLPPVHIARTAQDMHPSAPDDAAGMYHRGEVHLVDRPWADVGKTWAHEVVAHHGIRALLGSQKWRATMNAVAAGARAGDPELIALRDRVRSLYVDDFGRNYLPGHLEADEVAAAMVEERFDSKAGTLPVEGAMRKRLKALAGYFAREKLYADVPVDAAQLEGLLLEAQELLRRGRPGWARKLWWYPSAIMSKPMGPRVPARSLAESESMLAAERQRDASKLEWQALGMLGVLILCAIGFVGSIVYWILVFFGVIRLF